MNKKKIVQCVPNFSEGRDKDKIEKIVNAFRGKNGVKLLDYSSDEDHNRTVVTVIGEPEALKDAVIEAVGSAVVLIDLTKHKGQHPRMGAVDVIPFIPIRNIGIEELIDLSKEVAQLVYDKYKLPSFLYEKSASAPHRENLAKLRKGEFENMASKIESEDYAPDYGVDLHPTAGIVAIGARMPLVAYNVILDTENIEIANKIARAVRHINGGLRYVKAIGIEMEDRGLVQVSMNMTDYTKTPLYRVFELIRVEARRYGVNVVASEVIGLVPMDALIGSAEYYLGIENFSVEQVLEKRIME
ncbi:MAG: glutamate formimidoyltransferase [Firmicutes bacterium]|jgi:glutamate formiminotransferase|nr:glutamate formimidoyltransferase [Bacillota bacterium]